MNLNNCKPFLKIIIQLGLDISTELHSGIPTIDWQPDLVYPTTQIKKYITTFLLDFGNVEINQLKQQQFGISQSITLDKTQALVKLNLKFKHF